jgi:hypothetical protein
MTSFCVLVLICISIELTDCVLLKADIYGFRCKKIIFLPINQAVLDRSHLSENNILIYFAWFFRFLSVN